MVPRSVVVHIENIPAPSPEIVFAHIKARTTRNAEN